VFSNPFPRYLSLLLTAVVPAFAGIQAQDHIILLEQPDPIHHASFSRVIVQDDRPDTTSIGIDEDGKPIRFNTGVSRAITDYIQAAVSPDPKKIRIVLIDIKELDIQHDGTGRKLSFSAEIYTQKNDSLWLKISSFHKSRYLGYSSASGIRTMLSSVIGAIDVGLSITPDSPSLLTRMPNLNSATPVLSDWCPIFNRKEVHTAGYYPNFEAFRNDSLVPCNCQVKALNDSVYLVSSGNDSSKSDDPLSESFWAFADTSGRLYLRVIYDQFVMLTQTDNGFYFRLPHQLPDMHHIQRINKKIQNFDPNAYAVQGSAVTGGSLSGVPLAIIGTMMVDICINITATLIHNAEIKGMQKSGLKSDKSRYCRLDMNNGRIYY
jgi:hypothetical protein